MDLPICAANICINIRWDASCRGGLELQNHGHWIGRILPKIYTGIWEPVQRKAMAINDIARLNVI